LVVCNDSKVQPASRGANFTSFSGEPQVWVLPGGSSAIKATPVGVVNAIVLGIFAFLTLLMRFGMTMAPHGFVAFMILQSAGAFAIMTAFVSFAIFGD
jgi:hypothetical protein